MSGLRIAVRVRRHDVLVIGPTTLVTEAVLLGSVAVMVLALQAAAPGQRVWPTMVFAVLAAAAAVVPDSSSGLLALCWYAGAWAVLVPETGTSLACAVPAGIAALAFHAALAVVAALPPGGEVDAHAAAGLVGRFGLAALTAVVVALPVPLSRGALLPDAVAGVLLLLLAVVPRLAAGGDSP
ncbi:MAG TPA: hypothetical protein VJ872_06470 [Nocardioides sp.]|nr:hypothetical protein [Nocardioides sp.]